MKFVLKGVAAVSLWLAGCAVESEAVDDDALVSMSGGLSSCVAPALRELIDANGFKPSCEPSAAATVDGKVWIASDKQLPSTATTRTAFMQYSPSAILSNDQPPTGYLHSKGVLEGASKIEAMAYDAQSKTVFAITAFDNATAAAQNQLLAIPTADPSQAYVVGVVGDERLAIGDAPDTVGIRSRISSALGAPYFKIEGIAVIDGTLYLGVRESGADKANKRYRRTVLKAALLQQVDRSFQVSPVVELAFEISGADDVGISDLLFDPAKGLVYILGSTEDAIASPSSLGGRLWTMSKADFVGGKASGAKLHAAQFRHKTEGLTLFPDGRLLVIADDDRVESGFATEPGIFTGTRRKDQFAYYLLRP